MRQSVKDQILPILDSMYELHYVIAESKNNEQRKVFIQDCQEASQVIKEVINENATIDVNITENHTKYVENLDKCFDKLNIEDESINELNSFPRYLKEMIEIIPTTYHVVFLPYKASMWDSLESIWIAAKKDENCIPYIIPIPYFEYDRNNNKWNPCYEGELFPENLPITHFQDYSLEIMRPEVVYIHNPYDNRNLVTTIHPNYYSEKLKQFTHTLIYVPYFVTSGFWAPEHLDLPVYYHVDYIIVQSEHIKKEFINMPYYHKVLTFGSPKLDHIIHTCENNREIFTDWKSVLGNNKIIMLNTSISSLLNDGEIYINKLFHVFKMIKKKEGISLIWRPHPLIKSTIKSMRPDLMKKYEDLVDYFIKFNIGILDQTTNMSKTIAIADAYIGEGGTSVINLFEVVGKPIFILDNTIEGAFTDEEIKRMFILDLCHKNNEIIFIAYALNGIFQMDLTNKKIQLLARMEGQAKWLDTFFSLDMNENEVYLTPFFASKAAKYNIDTQKMIEINNDRFSKSLEFKEVVKYKEKVFYLPYTNHVILEYNIVNKSWTEHAECINNLPKNYRGSISTIWDYAIKDNILWMTMENSNCICEFNMDNGGYQYHQIGEKNYGYSAICIDREFLWISEVSSGCIVRWNYQTFDIKRYKMPIAIKPWSNNLGIPLTYTQLIDMNNWIVAVPGFSKYAIKLNKQNGKIDILVSEFWEGTDQVSNGYNPKILLNTFHAKKISETQVWVQRRNDRAVAIIDVEMENFEFFYPTMSENLYEYLLKDDDGFEQSDQYHVFCRRESRFFSLDGFINDLIQENLGQVKKRQAKAITNMAENLDGTSGEKIYKYFINELFRME